MNILEWSQINETRRTPGTDDNTLDSIGTIRTKNGSRYNVVKVVDNIIFGTVYHTTRVTANLMNQDARGRTNSYRTCYRMIAKADVAEFKQK